MTEVRIISTPNGYDYVFTVESKFLCFWLKDAGPFRSMAEAEKFIESKYKIKTSQAGSVIANYRV